MRWRRDDGSEVEVPDHLGRLDATALGRATRRAVARALAEDLGDRGDVTAAATVPASARGEAAVVARAEGVVYGLEVLLHVFEQVDSRVEIVLHVEDGTAVTAGQRLATLEGPVRSLLTGERVALNFLGHLSGIATRTRRFVDAAGPDVIVRDTRKTTPGLRLLEKAAVRAGGGYNHRIGLHDALLVKDNHIDAAGGVAAAVEAALAHADGRHVQVEVRDLGELDEALRAGATDILLDNFEPDEVRRAVQRTGGRAALEASGNVTEATVGDYVEAGVSRVAVGRLTHSAPWLDVAVDLVTGPTEAAPNRSGVAAAALWGDEEAGGAADADDAPTAEEARDAGEATSTEDADAADPGEEAPREPEAGAQDAHDGAEQDDGAWGSTTRSLLAALEDAVAGEAEPQDED